jgi:phosphatidylserine/phosphatidylglycerophosphate/cardiolipin synthase-like enzyme
MQKVNPLLRLIVALAINFPFAAAAEEVKYLLRPEQALAAILTEVESAEKSIDIATFIFEPCHSSTQILLDLLAQRARQGVKVRILLDDLQQKSTQQKVLTDFAAKNGMEFRFYNKFEKNLRLHIKMLIVDGKSFVSGGRNLSDEYFSYSVENNYVDRDILVKGDSARQAKASFDELWNSSMTSKKTGRAEGFTNWVAYCPRGLASRVEPLRKYIFEQADVILNQAPTRRCNRVSFRADAPDFSHPKYSDSSSTEPDAYMSTWRLDRKRASKAVLGFMNDAKTSLFMENWVYMPVFSLEEAFNQARARRVKIEVLTNSDIEDGPQFFREAMDYAISVSAAKHSRGSQKVTLVSSKGSLTSSHLLTPKGAPVHLHSKVMIRDGRDLLVGSFNLDSRSYNQNLEQVLIVRDCPALAEDALVGFSEINAVKLRDVAGNLVPPKKEPSLLAKMFAMISLVFL